MTAVPESLAGERADNAADAEPLRILHVILMLGETNSQYNEHCLPQKDVLRLSICTYFKPKLQPPDEISLFAGNGTLRGFLGALRNAVAAEEYDAVHAHAAPTGTILALLFALHPGGRRLRRTSVYTVHDSYYDYKLRHKLMMLPAFATFRRVVFCSHAAYDSYPRLWRRLVGRRGTVVQNSADLDRVERTVDGIARGGDGAVTILSVGRLEEVKRPLDLLEAFRRGADDRARLVFIGAGALEDELREAVAATGLQDRVELTGLIPRDDVFRRSARADLYVSTSRGEGLPVAVMEVMATGCPVVLSDIPPHREVVEGSGDIPLVRPGDVDGFAREIRRFVEMRRVEREEIGRRCREHARSRFALPRMHAGYERVYRELRDAERSSR